MFDFDITIGQKFTHDGEEWIKVGTVTGNLALAVKANASEKSIPVYLVEAPKFKLEDSIFKKEST